MATRDLLIDTSIFIDHIRKENKSGSRLFHAGKKYDLFISTPTVYELYAGATDKLKRKDVDDFLLLGTVLPFTREVAEQAAILYRELRRTNKLIDVVDIFIGATALFHDLPILTLNVKHFKRIDGLKLLEL